MQVVFCCIVLLWAPHKVWIVFAINFVNMLFPGVCFVFMYLFVYVIVKSNNLLV